MVVRAWLGRLAWWAVLLVAWLAPFQPMRPLIEGEVSDLRTAPALGFLAVGLWGASLIAARRRPNLPQPLTLALAVFLGVALVSALLAPSDQLDALKFTARLMLGAGVCLAAADLATTWARRWTLAAGLVVAASSVAVLGLAEFAAVGPILTLLGGFKVAPSQVGEAVRVSSTFVYTTITSMYLELMIPLALAWLWRAWAGQRWWQVIGAGLALALMLQAMLLTFTRSGLAATGAGLLIMALAAWWRGARGAVRLAAGTGVAMAALVGGTAWLTPTLGLRLRTENDRAWYGAVYAAEPLPPLTAGEVVTATVRVTNTGRLAWRSTELRPFNLSYHWLAHHEDSVAVWEGARAPLRDTIEPGQSVTVQMPLVAPPHSGPFRLGWDVVQDHVTWFSAKAVPMGLQPVEVLPRRERPPVEPPPILLQPMPRESAVDLSPGRLTLWRVAWQMLLDRPLLGVGPDNFRLAYGRYTGQDIWDTGVHANNIYIEMAADMGVLGALAFLGVVGAMVRLMWRAIANPSPGPYLIRGGEEDTGADPHPNPRPEAVRNGWMLAAALAAGQGAWLLHGLFDYFYAFLPLALVYWVLLGTLASVWRPGESQG